MTTTLSNRRLAGIRFENRAPELPAVLPRMDVAVFVGFASEGPLHVPVPIESPARFDDVFGGELHLARDPSTGAVRRAYLAPTVRAFFANGGRRCWVVRVADESSAERTRFGLPGVLRVTGGGALEPAVAAARSPGAAYDHMGLSAALAIRSVEIEALESLDALVASGWGEPDPGARPVPRLALRGEVRAGDVVRLRSAIPGGASWLGFVPLLRREPARPVATFVARSACWFREVDAPAAPVLAAAQVDRFDAAPFAVQSPAALTVRRHEGAVIAWPAEGASGARPQMVLEVRGIERPEALAGEWLRVIHEGRPMWMLVTAAYADARAGSAVARVEGSAFWQGGAPDAASLNNREAWLSDVVTFDLRAIRPGRPTEELRALGLSPLHARSWTSLPDDAAYFSREAGGPRPSVLLDSRFVASEDDVRAFRIAVDAPRFSASVADRVHSGDWFVPLGLGAIPVSGPVWRSPRTALEREGLGRFGPELFLHESLAASGTSALPADADYLRFGLGGAAPEALRGVHAAWAIDEASILAAPDSVHNRWERGAAPAPVEPAPAFAWSRPVPDTFTDCLRRLPVTPSLSLVGEPDAQGTFRLTWEYGGERDVCFVLQESRHPSFDGAVAIWVGCAPAGSDVAAPVEHVIRGRSPGSYYYRVLAVLPYAGTPYPNPEALVLAVKARWAEDLREAFGGETTGSGCVFAPFDYSDWSNGVVAFIGVAPDWEEVDVRRYDPSTWMAVSRALARLSAARADAMALIALPGHARADEALALQRALLSPSGRTVDVGTRGASLPLQMGEAAAWGYAAMFHPWLTSAGEDAQTIPPVGAVAGMFAGRAIERGAWIAPANQPLSGAVALRPDVPEARRQEFLDRRLNLVRREPRGLLTLSQDTLAIDPDAVDSPVRPINVRRLLILLRRLVLKVGEPFVFEPNGENLRVRVRHTFESVLSQLQARGAFAGRTAAESYRVECSDSVNPPAGVEAGRFVVDIKVAPSNPLAFLTIRLVQVGERNRVLELV